MRIEVLVLLSTLILATSCERSSLSAERIQQGTTDPAVPAKVESGAVTPEPPPPPPPAPPSTETPEPATEVPDAVSDVLPPPCEIAYASPKIFATGGAVTSSPKSVLGTGCAFAIAPALPEGLALDVASGVITGTPTKAVAAAAYVVTASNLGGATTTAMSLAVMDPPSAPLGLTATAAPGGAVQLVWSTSAEAADALELERSEDGTAFTLLTSVAASATSVDVTQPVASRSYRLARLNAVGRAVSEAVVVMGLPPLPPPPAGLSVTSPTSVTARATWTQADATMVDTVVVTRQHGNDPAVEVCRVAASVAACDDSGLLQAKAYEYVVTFVNAAGSGPSTAPFSITTRPHIGTVRAVVGSGTQTTYAMQVLADGSVVVAGSFSGTVDFDPGIADTSRNSAGGTDAYLARYSAAGALTWVHVFGSTGDDLMSALRVLADGSLAVAGTFRQTVDFDPGAGNASVTGTMFSNPTTFINGYLANFAADGSFLWVKPLHAAANVVVNDLIETADLDLLVTGGFGASGSIDLDPSGAAATFVSIGGNSDVFLARYTPAGAYRWGVVMGGPSHLDAGRRLGEFPNGDLFLGVAFAGTVDFDPGAGTFDLTCTQPESLAVVRLTSAGAFVWAKHYSETNTMRIQGAAVTPTGDFYVSGQYCGTIDFDFGTGTAERTPDQVGGRCPAFLAKYGGDASFKWVKTFGGRWLSDSMGDVVVTPDGGALTVGAFWENHDLEDGEATIALSADSYDGFAARWDPAGTLRWAAAVGSDPNMTWDTGGRAVAGADGRLYGLFNAGAAGTVRTLDVTLATFPFSGYLVVPFD